MRGLVFNFTAQDVFSGKNPVSLTKSEWKILEQLALANGKVLSRSQLFFSLLGKEWDGISREVDIVVSRIRRKLGDRSNRQRFIETVRNQGYRLANKKIMRRRKRDST